MSARTLADANFLKCKKRIMTAEFITCQSETKDNLQNKNGLASLQESLDTALSKVRRRTLHDTPVHVLPIHEHQHRNEIIEYLHASEAAHISWPVDIRRAHIGIAGFFNFSIMAKTKPDIAILVDINEDQRKFWGSVLDWLRQSPTGLDFQKTIFAQLLQVNEESTQIEGEGSWLDTKYRLPLGNNEHVYVRGKKEEFLALLFSSLMSTDEGKKWLQETTYPQTQKYDRFLENMTGYFKATDPVVIHQAYEELSWMRDESTFQYFKKLAQQGNIVCATFDLVHDKEAARALKEWMIAPNHTMAADTIYTSSLYDFYCPWEYEDGTRFAHAGFHAAASAAPMRSSREGHVNIKKFKKNLQTLMSPQTRAAFLTSLQIDGSSGVLDGNWSTSYRANLEGRAT